MASYIAAGFGILDALKLVSTIIGTTGGLYGTIQFGKDLRPKTPPSHQVTYKIAVGLDSSKNLPSRKPGRKLTNAGGDAPEFAIFNDVGDHLGDHRGGKIPTARQNSSPWT